MRHMRWMWLETPKITDRALDVILHMQSLELLWLTRCNNLSDTAIRRLVELPNLKEIRIDTPQISEATKSLLREHIQTVMVY